MKIVKRKWDELSGQRGDFIVRSCEILIELRASWKTIFEKPAFTLKYKFDNFPILREYFTFDKDGECILAYGIRNCSGRVWLNVNCARRIPLLKVGPTIQYSHVELRFSRQKDMTLFMLRFGENDVGSH